MSVSLHQLLKTMVEKGGTDLHVTTNSPPLIRIDGMLVTTSTTHPMTAVDTKKLAYSVLTDAQKHRFEETLELDISVRSQGPRPFSRQPLSCSGARWPGLSAASRTRSSAFASSVCRRPSRPCATNLAGWCWSPAPPARANRPPWRR